MAAKYHVRLRGKVHGPFSSSQLKQLVSKGQITEEAEIRQVGGDKWYPATRVAGLFDGASTGGSSVSRKSASSSGASARSGAGKRPARRKKKPVVDASDVFDLDDGEDEDLDDVDFFEDEEYDEPEFVDEDDGYDRSPSRSSRSSRRGGRRSRGGGGTSWDQVRIGLLLVSIGLCILAGSFVMQALLELIAEPMAASAMTRGGFGGGGSRSTEKLLRLLLKGSIFTAPLGNIVLIVGCSLAVFLPTEKAAKGLVIAALSTIAVHTLMHFVYVVGPAIDDGVSMGFGRFAFGMGSSDFPIEFVLTWFPLFAALILTSLVFSSIGAIKKDYHLSDAAVSNIWFIGIFAGIYVVTWIIGQIWEPSGSGMGETSAKAIIWLMVLFRLGHITLYGVYLGRLIPQSFTAKDLV